MTAARPSRTSSPSRLSSFSFSRPFSRAYLFSVPVSAALKPERCEPPSWVLMLFANEKTDSTYLVFHCIATSTCALLALALEVDDVLVDRVLRLFTWSTKSRMPPS